MVTVPTEGVPWDSRNTIQTALGWPVNREGFRQVVKRG